MDVNRWVGGMYMFAVLPCIFQCFFMQSKSCLRSQVPMNHLSFPFWDFDFPWFGGVYEVLEHLDEGDWSCSVACCIAAQLSSWFPPTPLGCRTPALFGEVYICQPKCQLPSRSKSNQMRPTWDMPQKAASSRLRDVLKMWRTLKNSLKMSNLSQNGKNLQPHQRRWHNRTICRATTVEATFQKSWCWQFECRNRVHVVWLERIFATDRDVGRNRHHA